MKTNLVTAIIEKSVTKLIWASIIDSTHKPVRSSFSTASSLLAWNEVGNVVSQSIIKIKHYSIDNLNEK